MHSRGLVMDAMLPGNVLKQIQAHYVAAVAQAEHDYIHGKEDERALTEALGEAHLNLDDTVEGEDGRVYHLIADYQKINRRRQAPGANGSYGIFQIEISGSTG